VTDLPPDSPPETPPPPKPHPSGWRVDPAPGGRGAPPESKPPMIPRSRWFIDALARALLERETLDQPEAYEVAGVEPSEAQVTVR